MTEIVSVNDFRQSVSSASFSSPATIKTASGGQIASSWKTVWAAMTSEEDILTASAMVNLAENPVAVREGKVHISETKMEVGKFYLVEYKKRTFAFKKLPDGKIDVYEFSR